MIGDVQHAGTLSSCCSGGAAVIALFATPIMSQLMDMYGRRVFAIVSSVKSVAIAAPMVVGGVIVHQNDGGRYGEDLTGNPLTAFKVCVGVWFFFTLAKASTYSSQGYVAIGDIFDNAHHRAVAVGVYTLSTPVAGFATYIGSYLPLMTTCIVAASIAVLGVLYNLLFFPETCDLSAYSPEAITTPLTNQAEAPISSRRCFYPELEGSDRVVTAFPAPSRLSRLQLCVSPARGINMIRKDTSAFVATLIACAYFFSAVISGNTMNFYLAKRLHFAPNELSFVGTVSIVTQIVTYILVNPIVGRYLSCPTTSIIGSIFVACSLVLIGVAQSPLLVYFGVAIGGLGCICFPALVAVIIRKVVAPEQVSLVVNTIMALNFAISALGDVIGGTLFSLLPESLLFLTFLISGAFAIPMFVLSIYLRMLLLQEERERLATSCPRGEEGTVA